MNTITDIASNNQIFSQTLSRSWEKTKGQTLFWKQPKRLKSAYLLRSKEHNLGTLRYEQNYFVRRGLAKTSKGEWRFKYTRFSLPKVTISTKNSILAETILETNWGWYGNLELSGGYQYIWKPTQPSENKYCFTTTEDEPIMIFRPHFGFFKLEAEVEVNPEVLHNPHFPLLSMLGWFLVLLRVS